MKKHNNYKKLYRNAYSLLLSNIIKLRVARNLGVVITNLKATYKFISVFIIKNNKI